MKNKRKVLIAVGNIMLVFSCILSIAMDLNTIVFSVLVGTIFTLSSFFVTI